MVSWNDDPVKLCECGCGEPVPLSSRNRASRGIVKGQQLRFVHGHAGRRSRCIPWERHVDRVIAGERRPHPGGYQLLYLPMHPAAVRGCVYEHRIVMERTLGRFLTPHEHVHHCNGQKCDNRPENLKVVASDEHTRLHLRAAGFVRNQFGIWPLRNKGAT